MTDIKLTPQENFEAGLSLELEFWNDDAELTSDAMNISEERHTELANLLQDSNTARMSCLSKQLHGAINCVQPRNFSELIWVVQAIGYHNGHRSAKLDQLLGKFGGLNDLLGDE